MYLIRLLIIFLVLVQLSSFISSSSVSSSATPEISSIQSTTVKPKTSAFSRHFNKLITPFKKLFSSKPKPNTQLNQTLSVNTTDLQLDELNKPNQAFNRDSVDQLLLNSTLDETNQTISANTSDINDLNVSDSIDFNLTEEINLKDATNSIVDPVKLDTEQNKVDTFKHEEEIVTNSISLLSTSTLPSKPTINQQIITTTSLPILETTTNLIYRKKSQSLKEDETRICFEIEELNVRKCYIQVPNVGNFIQSRNYCETHFQHGRLITMNTAEEENFLIINSVYYFWTSFQVKLGLTLDLVPKIAAIKPAYKQSNSSIALIKKFDFNQNLVINPNDKSSLIENDKLVSYPTNDEDEYEPDDIRLDHQGKDQLIVLVPKLYCLEASLSFEDGKPLYKWIVKDCNQESSSSVCELSEQLIEEDTDASLLNENRSEDSNDKEIKMERKENEEKEDQSKFVNESVNKLVNQFLKESSNKPGNNRPILSRQYVTESDDDAQTESSDEETFKAILPDILKDLAQSTTPAFVNKSDRTDQTSQNSVNSLTTTELSKLIELSASTFPPLNISSTINSTTTVEHMTTLASTTINYTTDKIEISVNSTDTINSSTDKPITTTVSTNNSNCKTEQNPLIYQFVFAMNIAFNSFCALVVNLFRKDAIDDNQMKQTKLVLLSALILLFILLLTVILLMIVLAFRFMIRRFRSKRRLLLEELSEKKFNSALDKKFDNFYYNVPHQSRTCRNIYVPDYKVGESNLLNNSDFITRKNEISNSEKYQSIPKEYFY